MTTLIILTLMAASPHLHRLELVAARLDHVAPSRYDMDTYGTTRDADDPGFVGCAAGHATALFKSEGFTLAPVPFRPGTLEVAYQGFRGQAAVTAFFGLTAFDAGELFESRDVDPRDPRMISSRIRRFIACEQRERGLRP